MSEISQLLTQDPLAAEIILAAGQVGRQQNLPVFVVGGFVRDMLMGRENTDIDLMVEGDGIHFAHQLAEHLGIHPVVEYTRFGTAMIPHPHIMIEVASARTESYDPDSRKPKVVLSTIENDMSRRDFTVNAIAASINPESFGQLVDPFDGIHDLEVKHLITPLDPDVTFQDDPLRMLRAARFAAQLNFTIDPAVIDSIKRQRDRIQIISWERITEEFIKILSSEQPSIGFLMLKEVGLLHHTFPELDVMSGVQNVAGKGHKDVFLHTLQVVDNAAQLSDKMEIRFAALVHDIAKPGTKKFQAGKGWTFHGHDEIGRRMLPRIAKRMKLSNDLRDYLMLMTKLHLRPIALAQKAVTDSAVRRLMVEAEPYVDDLMILCRADITTKNQAKVRRYMTNFERVEEFMQDVQLRDELRAFQSPVRGDIIMRDFQLSPGPLVGKIKSAIESAILDGRIDNDYDAAYEYMMSVKSEFLEETDPNE